MQPTTTFWRTALIGSLLLLAACSPAESPVPTMDEVLIYTQAVQTISAQFTQTAAAFPTSSPTIASSPTLSSPNTFTPVVTPPAIILPITSLTATLSILPPQATPTGALCNNSGFYMDIGVADGAILKPGQTFAKGWLIQNTGYCVWGFGYTLVRIGGNTDFEAPPYVIRDPKNFVQPGAIVEISFNMTAPRSPGTYEAHYQMYSDKNVPFGTGMFVRIEVRK